MLTLSVFFHQRPPFCPPGRSFATRLLKICAIIFFVLFLPKNVLPSPIDVYPDQLFPDLSAQSRSPHSRQLQGGFAVQPPAPGRADRDQNLWEKGVKTAIIAWMGDNEPEWPSLTHHNCHYARILKKAKSAVVKCVSASELDDSIRDLIAKNIRVEKDQPVYASSLHHEDVKEEWGRVLRDRLGARASPGVLREPPQPPRPYLHAPYHLDEGGEDDDEEEILYHDHEGEEVVRRTRRRTQLFTSTTDEADPHLGIKANEALKIYHEDQMSGRGVDFTVVALLDTGVDLTHPEIAPRLYINAAEVPGDGNDNDENLYIDDVNGLDLINVDGDPRDDSFSGHGTMVAGMIASVGVHPQSTGVSSLAGRGKDSIKLLPIKTLDYLGHGWLSDQVIGMDYAVAQGAQVIALPWSNQHVRSWSALVIYTV